MSFLEDLGIDKETYQNAEPQKIREAFKPIPSGAYISEIEELATFQTQRGAMQYKVTINIPELDRSMDFFQTIQNGDKTVNEIGNRSFRHLTDAINTPESELSVVKDTIKARGKDVAANVVRGVKGKKVIALINEVHQKGAFYEETNEVEGWAKTDGTNAEGENIVIKFKEKVEKRPILTRQPKKGSEQKSSGESSDLKKDVESLI